MRNVSIVAKAVGVALVVMASSQVMAKSENATATVTVKNTFEMTVTKPLAFGTVRITADPAGTKTAKVVVPADGSQAPTATTDAPAAAQILTPGTPGEVTIAGVAAYSNLKIVFPAAAVDVVPASAAPGSPAFTIAPADFEAFITSGTNASSKYVVTSNELTADDQGAASFTYGATLTTSAVASTQAYQDVEYSATFPIEVTY